nr:glycosyltransferase family 4 protein [Ardenticatena sp.]
MRVLYSIGVKFAGGGIGSIAYQEVRALYQHQALTRLLCGSYRPTDIPADHIKAWGMLSRLLRRLDTFDAHHRFAYLHNVLYDIWSTRHFIPADVLLVWGTFGRHAIQKATKHGMNTIVHWPSSHPLFRYTLFSEEYVRTGVGVHPPQRNHMRALAEIKHADCVIVPSEFVAETFLQHGFPAERLRLNPYGVDTRRFHPPKQRPNDGIFRAIFVGQVGTRKGIHYLLDAWDRLGWRNAELLIVGKPVVGIKLLLQRYANHPTIRWIGHTRTPEHFYQQADVFVFPTLEEGSALVTYEALASGLPVITTKHAGSVVRHEREGLIIPIRDSAAIANALERLRANPGERQRMAIAARERALAFSWEAHGGRLLDIVRSIMDQSHREMT